MARNGIVLQWLPRVLCGLPAEVSAQIESVTPRRITVTAGDVYVNCDNSTTPPTLNVADFTCFLHQFAAGCAQ